MMIMDGKQRRQHAVDRRVGHDLLHLVHVLGRRQHLALVERAWNVSRCAKKPIFGLAENTFW